ncbi:heptaprenyl diphosphate synthase component 2 [Paraliobacillus quinghaiensis]|uniref:Heptaprenyl diphosphate synthase component 2 n=1 Tax=Paraliobacillus quinghaiensis TaxID=470815 RepID=A0A917THJ2_9BACI|nr:heptaprenyl diphosphate synthase component II [Paraliobacillus quinghaiensis]GGM22843.1 heptaprenyl diphosphate synthase component 2 [Paraliobacillus quinghaiensis]
MKLAMTYSYLKPDLQLIEKALEETVQADNPVLEQASTQLLHAGGKRLRPVFVLLAGQFGDYDVEKIKAVAVSLELIHMASLVHDDVIDESELRRGKPTVKAKWDNRIAMYTGDYIFARSLEYLSTLNNPKAHQILSKTMVELTFGEMQQIGDKYNLNQHLRNYLRRIKRKTALLIASSCQLGAIAANVPSEEEKQLYRYGYYIGMSYQIIDDILDFTASEQQLGKPAGSDLMQGNITLPVLYAMQNQDFYRDLQTTFSNPANITGENIAPLIQYIKKSSAIEESFALSDRFLQKAFHALDALPDIKAKQTFKEIASYIGKRKS